MRITNIKIRKSQKVQRFLERIQLTNKILKEKSKNKEFKMEQNKQNYKIIEDLPFIKIGNHTVAVLIETEEIAEMKEEINRGVIPKDKEMITMTIGEDIMKVQERKIETDKIRDKNHMNVKITEEKIIKDSHHVIVKKTNTNKNQIKIIKKNVKVIETENLL